MDTATAPFNDAAAADIVVRTSDGGDFYIHKAALTSVSCFFEHLLSDATLGSVTVAEATLPLITVLESTSIFLQIMLLLHPPSITKRLGPRFQTIEQAVEVVEALDKYCIEDLSNVVAASVMMNSPDVVKTTHPGHLYVVGARQHWPELCRAAARRSLDLTEEDLVRELTLRAQESVHSQVPMKDLLPLWRYRVACRKRARACFVRHEIRKNEWVYPAKDLEVRLFPFASSGCKISSWMIIAKEWKNLKNHENEAKHAVIMNKGKSRWMTFESHGSLVKSTYLDESSELSPKTYRVHEWLFTFFQRIAERLSHDHSVCLEDEIEWLKAETQKCSVCSKAATDKTMRWLEDTLRKTIDKAIAETEIKVELGIPTSS